MATTRALRRWIAVGFVIGVRTVVVAASWTEITAAQVGMPVDHITAMHRDQLGRVWLGTADGAIAVCDGTDCSVSKQPEPTQAWLTGPVYALATEADGDVWASIGEGLWKCTNGIWHRYDDTNKEVLSEHSCWSDWFFKVSDGVPFIPGVVRDLLVDRQNDLWLLLGCDIGCDYAEVRVVRFTGAEMSCWPSEPFSEIYLFRQIELLPGPRLWVTGMSWAGSELRLVQYEDGEWVLWPAKPWIVGSISATPDGLAWATGIEVADDGDLIPGAYRYENDRWEHIASFEASFERSPFYFGPTAADDAGGVWIVVMDALGADLRVVHVESEGRQLWYAGPEAGQGAPQGEPMVAVDGDGRLWLFGGEGLYVLEGASTAVEPSSWARVKAAVRRPD